MMTQGRRETMMTGEELKGKRKAMGLTQKDLGTVLGLSERTVARYEAKGWRTVPRWLELASIAIRIAVEIGPHIQGPLSKRIKE